MPKAKINDINLCYEVDGEDEAMDFFIGFSVDHRVWMSVFDPPKKR